MVFNSIDFLIFFPIVVIIYFFFPARIRYVWLLVASYYFYMSWNPRYVCLLITSTLITYISGILIQYIVKESLSKRKKKLFLNMCVTICVFLNLLILFFFKYLAFAIESVNRVCQCFGFQISEPLHDIILPIGISFYIFQALGYIIDVYRGEVEAEKNIFRYALFVSFFPQLVAGPIERSKNLLKQVKKPTYFSVENARDGLLIMAYGLFLKIVIADKLGRIVDGIYANWFNVHGMNLIIATMLFAIQIYCDFEGYSQLAIGSAKVLGFHINQNFDTPYLCTSVRDFWKRWHISLTGWFRDYLYIPLGGNRKGKYRKYLNTMVVFLVSGLWHGASWHFVIWGGINGIYNVIQEITFSARQKTYRFLKIDTNAFFWKCLCGVGTFFLIDISWLFFRAENVSVALHMLGKMSRDVSLKYVLSESFYQLFGSGQEFVVIVVALALLCLIDSLKRKKVCIKQYIYKQQVVFRWIIYISIILIIILWGAYGENYEQTQFIYFQF